MVETNSQEYWNELAKRGELEDGLFSQVENLTKKYAEADSRTIFSKVSPTFSFSKEFTAGLNHELEQIFSTETDFPPEEIKEKIKKFREEIKERLVIVHVKKIACEIIFDAYPFLKLIKALETIISEARFTVNPQEILIEFMDASRICLTRIILSDSSYQFYAKSELYLNIENFKNVLKCEANDKSSITLQFGEERLNLSINSEKFGSTINRTLSYIDLEIEDIPLDNLISIDYAFSFALEQHKFAYTIKNLGIYSDVIDISAGKQSVIFSEEGELGKGEFSWKKDQLLSFQFNEEETATEELSSAHLLFFLSWVDKITQVLGKKDSIQFSIKPDHPIRIENLFPQLGNSSLLYFLAPRTPIDIEEGENDDDLMEF